MNKRPMNLGFRFAPFPREIWKDNIQLSLAGFRLLGYLLNVWLDYGMKENIRLSDDELVNGRKDKDGNRIDQGCGIRKRQSIAAAREELIFLGWLQFKQDDSDKGRVKRYYTLLVREIQANKPDPTEERFLEPQVNEPTPTVNQGEPQVQPGDTSGLPDQTIEVSSLEVFSLEKKAASPEAHLPQPPKTKNPLPEKAITLAQKLADSIEANYPDSRKATAADVYRWAGDIDKLHRIDGKSWELIEQILSWSQHDTFWQQNIQSGGTFRKQWNKLLAGYQKGRPQQRQQENLMERLMREAQEEECHGDKDGDPDNPSILEAEFSRMGEDAERRGYHRDIEHLR